MNTAVMRLRVRATGPADGAALRRLASSWLARLQPQDHGLPDDAIVLVRALRSRADAGPGPRVQAWRAGADKAWSHTVAGAARLVPGQAVPAAAAAVWCADASELLVNLLHDLAQGTLAQAWWWSLALQSKAAAGSLTDAAWHCLQDHARQLPSAVLQTPPARAGVAWATGSRTQQQALDQALVQQFGVHVAWFDALHAQTSVECNDCGIAAAGWVALCRQIATDPTPLRRAPAAHAVVGVDAGRAPVAEERAAMDELARVAGGRVAAEESLLQTAAVHTSARPRSRPVRSRLRVDPATSSSVDQRIASLPVDVGASLGQRPQAGTHAPHPAADQAAKPSGWPARMRKQEPAAPVANKPPPDHLRSPMSAAADRLADPVSEPWLHARASRPLHSRYAGVLLLLNVALATGLYGDFSQPRLPGLPLHPWHWLWLAARQLHGPSVNADALMAWLHEAGGVGTAADPALPAWQPDAQALEPWSQDSRPWVLLHQEHRKAVVLQHPAGFTVARLDSADELPALWTRLQLPPPELRWQPRSRLRQPSDPLHGLWPYLWARLALALHGHAPPTFSAKALARWATAQAGRVEISAARLRAVYPLGQWPLALRLAGLDRNPGWIPAAGCELLFDFE